MDHENLTTPAADNAVSGPQKEGTIHPIIIFPYTFPQTITHLTKLYNDLISRLKEPQYARPITIVNFQTRQRNEVKDTYKETVKLGTCYSDFHYTWCVDTCQMWLSGFGKAYEQGNTGDVYWLIPGDFQYASPLAQEKDTLNKMLEIPRFVNKQVEGQTIDLCLGEIKVPVNSAKQLIDTYGTYGLLYNWFPAEGKGIRLITDKPRTEFFAISHSYLSEMLERRWYAYEQTLVILLRYMSGKEPRRKVPIVKLGRLEDEEAERDSLSSAMMQVERTERVLKLYWREDQLRREPPDWRDKFGILDRQSEQIRGAALVILEQLLRRE